MRFVADVITVLATMSNQLYKGGIETQAPEIAMPDIQPHPSYGYATEAQINRLKELGPSLERDMILRAIKEQTPVKPRKKK